MMSDRMRGGMVVVVVVGCWCLFLLLNIRQDEETESDSFFGLIQMLRQLNGSFLNFCCYGNVDN